MKVSVIMPAYNAARYIEQSIRSVISQTFTDWELLVIDDCSDDETAGIADRLAGMDDRIKVIRREQNCGVAQNRNFGVTTAQGEWIAFLDSDDLWNKDKLKKQVELIKKHPDAEISYTASTFIDEDGKAYPCVMHAKPMLTYNELLHRNLMSCSSVMVKRDMMLRFPMENDEMHEDYVSWLRILREVPCAYGLDEPMLTYRLSKASKSGNRVRSGKMIYRSYRCVGYGVIRSAWLTLRYIPYSVKKRKRILGSRN